MGRDGRVDERLEVGGRGEREEEHGGDEDTSMAILQLPITKKNSNLLFISTIQPHSQLSNRIFHLLWV